MHPVRRRGRAWLMVLSVALLLLSAPKSLASWLEVHGDSAQSEVRFLWVPVAAWPGNVAAIDVLRAPCDAQGVRSGPWVRTTIKPLKPSVMVERAWADVHHAEVAQTLYRAKLMAASVNGNLKFEDDPSFMAYLRGLEGEMINSLRGNLLHQDDVVWMLGFGTVRQRPVDQAGQLYGFFEVDTSGARAAEPLATWRDIYVADDDPRL